MATGKILYALENRTLYIRLNGEIRHTICAGFDTLISQSIQMDQADKLVVDLRQATFLDSTTLGIIARKARYVQKKSGEKPVIISTNTEINHILDSVQFNILAKIVTDWETFPDHFFESENILNQNKTESELVLESHKELAKINKERNKFNSVIELLEKKYKNGNK